MEARKYSPNLQWTLSRMKIGPLLTVNDGLLQIAYLEGCSLLLLSLYLIKQTCNLMSVKMRIDPVPVSVDAREYARLRFSVVTHILRPVSQTKASDTSQIVTVLVAIIVAHEGPP